MEQSGLQPRKYHQTGEGQASEKSENPCGSSQVDLEMDWKPTSIKIQKQIVTSFKYSNDN